MELSEVTQQYNIGVEMLASMQESHKQYEEQISVLQESLEKEEQCKKGLEDLQQRLYKEIADRVQAEKQLRDELEQVKKQLVEQQSQFEERSQVQRNELEERLRQLEYQLDHERSEKNKLQGIERSLKEELAARRQSRVLIQEEVESLRFQLKVDAENLSAEKHQRLALEKELEILKEQLTQASNVKEKIEDELAMSLDARRQLEEHAEKIRLSLHQMENEYNEAESRAREMELKLDEAVLQKDELHTLYNKLESELLVRERSRTSLQNEIQHLKKALQTTSEESLVRDNEKEKEIALLKEKLKAEKKVRKDLEYIHNKLEEEIEKERMRMIPSSSLEELEEAFANAKSAFQVKLTQQEEKLKITQTKVDEERQARIELENELVALKEQIKVTEEQTKSTLIRAGALTRERSVLDLRRSGMPNGRTTGRYPISGEQSTFVPKKVKLVKPAMIPALLHTNLECKGDEVDSKLSEILSAAKFQVPIQRVKEGVYNLAGKNVNMRILNGYLVIRVGGGYMKFDEWCEKYGKAEGIKVNRETLMTHSAIKNTGKMTVGVHVRKGANVHTFLHSSVKLH